MIAVLTDPFVGGTFLTWTIHYLAGHKKHFNYMTDTWEDLTTNPLVGINAHGFKSNHPSNYNKFSKCLSSLSTCETNDFHSMYFTFLHQVPFSLDHTDTKKAIAELITEKNKIVLLTNQSKNSLYQKSSRYRAMDRSFNNPGVHNESNEEQLEDFVSYFFKDSYATWKKLNLNNVWDQREFLALNLPWDETTIADLVDLSGEHYDVDCLELYNLADSIVHPLFEYLEIDICNERLESWTQIYQQWRRIHYNRLNFLWSFDKIMNYILHGYDMDLERFNLDIVQESYIQKELIYKHNLNLKTWQLEKFKNTKQLHNLLEPNTHDTKKS